MKKRNAIFLFVTVLSTQPALARCVLDTWPPLRESVSAPLQIPDFTLQVDTNLSGDYYKSVDQRNNSHGEMVNFLCDQSELYGKNRLSPLSLKKTTGEISASFFTDLIMMPLAFNRLSFGELPFDALVTNDRFHDPSRSYFRIEIFNAKPQLRLKKSEIVNNFSDNKYFAKNWINSDLSNAILQQLHIDQLHNSSTPSCHLDGEKIIEFNHFYSDNLVADVGRPIYYPTFCISDYGSYYASEK